MEKSNTHTMRDEKGRFVKGMEPNKTSFKKGQTPWNKLDLPDDEIYQRKLQQQRIRNKRYRQNHPELSRQQSRNNYYKNLQLTRERRRIITKKYRINNPDKIKLY
ncbi:MAG: hypothetical protein KC444_09295, partial [Nitrosopumilus sp.]|nr:hypothetical protein [Nitrosopumilus sp.]